ncbi:single-stranded-DNA-specific exonuclease RecJ [Limoniibacter endophyticus]|uniref:Single-stranded-DNA-specific exonuclease RecJ n=1 Tax=Limoniibacter endophyticus TaxID=1565040 RepID=A0A8J3DJP0_9HYPH|nr:single-stranded-DNA-specific exonuclease RecJ [Limoniibacter endophyticus]GHC78802.1 single-stranded-DNA-specific exonuclease RecJ [Limoniibacter endophyticus]
MTIQKRLFLDIRSSANGIAWHHRLDERQEAVALAIAQSHGVPDLVARILAGRGVGLETVTQFMAPTIRDLLPDPLTLTGMERAAARIVEAILRRERVAIFGDYDVDGASSSALMKRYLDHFGVSSEIYIPDRIFEGYGPNPDAMRDLVERGAKLIVTVDCGTNSAVSIDAASEAGAHVVVLDHHQQGGPLPNAVATVNPNREDDLSGQGHLCAAGVVFLTLVQVSRVLRDEHGLEGPKLMEMLDLVALATICDVVPLVGVNRAFVVKGLEQLRKLQNPGLAALAKHARIGEPINGFHLGFLLGPRINAGGRIGDAALGSRLLSTEDPVEAEEIAATLDRLNQERQALEQIMLAQAKAEADAELMGKVGPAVLVTASEEWHPGIVGLLASRLKDHARRPAFAIAFNKNGMGTGSGRSIAGFDLGLLVRKALEAGLLAKGGGHAMAAGITVEKAKLGELRAFFEENSASAISRLRAEDSLSIDAALSSEGATLSLMDILEKAGPFGQGHVSPVLVLPRHKIARVMEVGTGHLRVDLESLSGGRLEAIAFRAIGSPLGDFLIGNRDRQVHLAGGLSVNHWNGSRKVQFRISDAALEAKALR